MQYVELQAGIIEANIAEICPAVECANTTSKAFINVWFQLALNLTGNVVDWSALIMHKNSLFSCEISHSL